MKDSARKWDFATVAQMSAALGGSEAHETSAMSEASPLLRVHCATCLQRAYHLIFEMNLNYTCKKYPYSHQRYNLLYRFIGHIIPYALLIFKIYVIK